MKQEVSAKASSHIAEPRTGPTVVEEPRIMGPRMNQDPRETQTQEREAVKMTDAEKTAPAATKPPGMAE